ncbi:hypothetical protein DHW03_10550 [Pedobacter yonginense]|uniref:Putative auto-transporter adhesin head GIN domain-containing protein n=1 Tax=Pedobacter yonginense TaxID=651869 RepID=A0A317EQ82_9SPHI|nr:DUF2807 domain-containing protein [Pedobacter yonginense]PWS27993.1 hypothetical protein DHW03_10550 [Pedobacter yonginense]
MKTLAKTLFATALTAVLFASSAATTFAAEPAPLVKTTSIKNVNRIWVSGNVKVVLTQGNEQSISGSDNFDPNLTSVISKGNSLYINSMENQQVTLNITLKDLERIEAYGQSVVVTNNNFDIKYLQLFLYQSATAKIKATTGSLYTVVKDDAVLKLNGTSLNSTLVATNMKNIKTTNFASARSEAYQTEALASDKIALRLSK